MLKIKRRPTLYVYKPPLQVKKNQSKPDNLEDFNLKVMLLCHF